jgi:hypothetical protein
MTCWLEVVVDWGEDDEQEGLGGRRQKAKTALKMQLILFRGEFNS